MILIASSIAFNLKLCLLHCGVPVDKIVLAALMLEQLGCRLESVVDQQLSNVTYRFAASRKQVDLCLEVSDRLKLLAVVSVCVYSTDKAAQEVRGLAPPVCTCCVCNSTILSLVLIRGADLSLQELSAACPAMRDEEYWAWSNIYLFISPNDLNILTTEPKYLSAGLVMMWSNCICTVIFFLIVNKVLKMVLQEKFTSLEVHEQFIICTHIILIIIFIGQLIPYSYLMARMLFSSQFADVLQTHYQVFFWSVSLHGMLYLVEGGFRSVVRLNSLLLLHHLLFYVMPILLFISGSVLVFKAGYVLDLFATYEFGLYASLILRRLRAPARWQQISLAGGVGVYAVTRIIQFVILSGLFLGTFDVESGDKWYWITLIVTLLLVIIQNFTFIIYYGMYTRLYAANAESAKKGRYSPVAEICPPDSDLIEKGTMLIKGNSTQVTESTKGL